MTERKILRKKGLQNIDEMNVRENKRTNKKAT